MMRTLRVLTVGISMLAIGVAAGACGDDDDDDADGGVTPAVTRPASAASPVDGEADQTTAAGEATAPAEDGEDNGAAGDAVTVTATEFQFDPAEITLSAGTATIILENAGSAPHTLTIYTDQEFTAPVAGADTGNVSGGGQGELEVTFDAAGGFFFRCEVHPAQMQGTITVE